MTRFIYDFKILESKTKILVWEIFEVCYIILETRGDGGFQHCIISIFTVEYVQKIGLEFNCDIMKWYVSEPVLIGFHRLLCKVKVLLFPLWTFSQGSKGIRQWPINLSTSPMIIHKITISGWNVWTINLMNQPINIEFKSSNLSSEH